MAVTKLDMTMLDVDHVEIVIEFDLRFTNEGKARYEFKRNRNGWVLTTPHTKQYVANGRYGLFAALGKAFEKIGQDVSREVW